MILRMLRRQAAVRSGGGFLRKSLSALGDRCWSKTSGKCKKPCDVESRTYTKRIMLACIPPFWVACRRVFSQCLLIALSSKMYHPRISRGRLPRVAAAAMIGVAMVTKDEEFAVMLIVQYVAYLSPSELCKGRARAVGLSS